MNGKDEIRIYRFKHYKRGQVGFAWNWNYEVVSPGEYDAGASTIDEARIVARNRHKETGLTIVYDWK